MRLILMLFMLSLGLAGQAGEDKERERLRADLPRMARELADASQHMASAMQRINLKPPAALVKAVEARQAAILELQQLLADPAKPLAGDKAEAFRDESQALRSRLGELYSLADALGSVGRQYPQCAGTSELARYVAFVRARLDGALAEASAGKSRGDDNTFSRQRRRHEMVLGVMESGRASAERWRRVPADAPVLREYQQQRQVVQTLAENGLEQPADWADDRELERQQHILGLMAERVALVQFREERLGDRTLPADAPSMVAVKAGLTAKDEVLQQQIAHRRTASQGEEAAWQRKDQELRQLDQLCGQMSNAAWDWLGIAEQIRESQSRWAERLKDTPPAIRDELAASQAKLDQQRDTAEQAMTKALTARIRLDALQAKGELWQVLRGYEQLSEDLTMRLRLATQEREFKAQAATATAALKRLAAARTAYLAARDQLRDQEQAAIRARLARDLAELTNEEAQKAVERSRATVSSLRDELDRVRQAAEAEQAAQPAAAQNPSADPGF